MMLSWAGPLGRKPLRSHEPRSWCTPRSRPRQPGHTRSRAIHTQTHNGSDDGTKCACMVYCCGLPKRQEELCITYSIRRPRTRPNLQSLQCHT